MSSKRSQTSKGKKRKAGASEAPAGSATRVPAESLDPLRTGMPAQDSIIDVKEFKKGKKVYRIIRTNEVDEYEHPPRTKSKKR